MHIEMWKFNDGLSFLWLRLTPILKMLFICDKQENIGLYWGLVKSDVQRTVERFTVSTVKQSS